MLEIKTLSFQNIKWHLLVEPDKEKLQQLQKKFNFHPLDIEDCLEKVQRPKLDIYEKYLFLVLHFPQWQSQNGEIKIIELKIFLGPDFLINISKTDIPLLDDLFNKAKNNPSQRKIIFKNSSFHLFYFIINELLVNISPLIKGFAKIIDDLDQELLKNNHKLVLNKISTMRRNLILFQTIVKPQIPIFKKMEKGQVKLIKNTYSYYWGNLADRLQSIWEQLEDFSQILEGLATTNESLLSYKTNEVIKILTIFSVVLLPLSLIAGIYGMNIKTVPFMLSSFSFIIIASLMTSIAVVMLLFFKMKKWL